MLHTDLKREDRIFYFTTCGWMMWNWLVSSLAVGATLVLFDGAPFHPDGNRLFALAAEERISVFGTSAKYLDAVKKAGLEPGSSHDLGALRAILSTGSPLVPESFDFVYRSIKADVHLASISGGTDIVSCFVLGNPIAPVWRGEIQTRGLGLAVEVWNDDGQPVVGEPGELVCTRPFPSMPVGFWNDPDGSRYRAAYFERFPGVWTHGDRIELTAHDGLIIYGRSDAVLNPGGVRIGTAEIYRQVEQIEEVLEALAVAPGVAGRRAHRAVRAPRAEGDAGRRAGRSHQAADPAELHAAPRAGQDRRGRRHPAHHERQDRRARGARADPRPAGQEHRRAGQPRGAGALSRPARAARLSAASRRIHAHAPADRPHHLAGAAGDGGAGGPRGARPSGAGPGAGRLAGGAGAERRARLGARAPAAGDASLPRSARRGPRSRIRCPISGRSAATSSPPRCIASTVRWPSAVRGSRRPISCVSTLLDALPDPVLLVAGGRVVVNVNQAAIALFGADPSDQPLEAQLRDPGLLAAVDQALAGPRQHRARPAAARARRGAPSGSRSCRCGCAGSRPR